jgi:putative CocE/NonD family hydrolase
MSYQFTEADFGAQAALPLRSMLIAWFDQWLMGKDSPLLSQPAAKIFIMGANEWRGLSEWPPANARPKKLFLESGGHANTLDGNGGLAEKWKAGTPLDQYVFDPRDPVPTRGGSVCCNPKVFPWGPRDQRPVEHRNDVLVYTSKPLKKDLEVVGPVQAVLYISTSALDTDFTAKLVDLFPDGYARNLTDGILRLRYRESLERPQRATPGQTYRIVVDAGVTGNVFRKGHSIRLEISSSNFPRFDRNPNTGGPIADEITLRKASQTVYHDREHPSHLVLMVVPAKS